MAWVICASAFLGATSVAVVTPHLWRGEADNARAVLDQPMSTDEQRASALTVLLRTWRADIDRIERETRRAGASQHARCYRKNRRKEGSPHAAGIDNQPRTTVAVLRRYLRSAFTNSAIASTVPFA